MKLFLQFSYPCSECQWKENNLLGVNICQIGKSARGHFEVYEMSGRNITSLMLVLIVSICTQIGVDCQHLSSADVLCFIFSPEQQINFNLHASLIWVHTDCYKRVCIRVL